jgi:hypothetical protein
VWGLTEGATKLAAEMCAREAGGARQILDAQRFEVAGIGEILGAQ